jgi:hypothetical protein
MLQARAFAITKVLKHFLGAHEEYLNYRLELDDAKVAAEFGSSIQSHITKRRAIRGRTKCCA